jgi:hypothetical protein
VTGTTIAAFAIRLELILNMHGKEEPQNKLAVSAVAVCRK